MFLKITRSLKKENINIWALRYIAHSSSCELSFFSSFGISFWTLWSVSSIFSPDPPLAGKHGQVLGGSLQLVAGLYIRTLSGLMTRPPIVCFRRNEYYSQLSSRRRMDRRIPCWGRLRVSSSLEPDRRSSGCEFHPVGQTSCVVVFL